MKKSLPIRRWLAFAICGALIFGSMTDFTSFASSVNRYSTSVNEFRSQESYFNDVSSSLCDIEPNSNSANSKSEKEQASNGQTNTNQNNASQSSTEEHKIDPSKENQTKVATSSNANSNPKYIDPSFQDTKTSDTEFETKQDDAQVSEEIQVPMMDDENNVQDGYISEEFIGRVSFNGSRLTQTISDTYLEIKLPSDMLEGISTDFSSTLINDLNQQKTVISGFLLKNGKGGQYIRSVEYRSVASEDGTSILYAHIGLNPLTRETDGSVEYHIRFKNDGSVPEGYVLPVDASFYLSNGEKLLEMETAYFRVYYPPITDVEEAPLVPPTTVPSDEPSTDILEVLPSPADETKPSIEEVPFETVPAKLFKPTKPKNKIETKDIRVSLKWEGDLNSKNLRPKSANALLFRNNNEGKSEFVQSIDLSNHAKFGEIWTSTFEAVEKTDEYGNEYEFYVELDIDEKSGIANYNVSNPISSIDGSKFTWIAKYNPINLNVKIRWEDNQNEHQVRPSSVKVQLISKTSDEITRKVGSEVTIHSGSWAYDFGAFPRYDESGTEITYLLSELDDDSLKNYPSSLETGDGNIPNRIFSFDNGNMTITNSVQEISVPIQIHWNEKNHGSHFRPAQIELKLIRDNGSLARPITKVFYGNRNEEFWAGEFNNLVKYDANGNEFRYSLTENNSLFSRNYELYNTYKLDGVIHIVNQLTLSSETAQLLWDQEHGEYIPKVVELELYRNAIGEIPQKTGTATVSTMMNKYTFGNLPKYNDHGQIYIYSIRQKSVSGNFVTEHKKEKDITFISNQYQGLNFDINLEWKGRGNKNRPDSVNIRLLRRTEDEDFIEVADSTLSLTTDQTKFYEVYKNQPKYSLNGKKYEYRVEEIRSDEVKEYLVQYTRLNEQTFEITHTRTLNGMDLRVDWTDYENQFGLRPDKFNIQLYQLKDDATEIKIGDPISVSKDKSEIDGNSWIVHLPNILRLGEDGIPIQYLVQVIPSTELGNYSFEMKKNIEDFKTSTMVVNATIQTKVIPVKMQIQGNEINSLRPKEMIFRLTRYLDDVQDTSFEQMLTTKPNDGLIYFERLAEQNVMGKFYDYHVEILNQNVFSNYIITEKYENGEFVFTLQYNPIDILFRMNWDDGNNSLDLRPKKLQFKLARKLKDTANNFNEVLGHELSFDGKYNTWVHVFKNLPKYDANGNEYEYGLLDLDCSSVMKNYKTNLEYNEITHEIQAFSKLQLKTIVVESNWIGDLNQMNERPKSLEANLYRKSELEKSILIDTKVLRGFDNIWSESFTELPSYDAFGNLYEYEVKLYDVQNYITTQVNPDVNQNRFVFTLQLDVRTIKAMVVWNDNDNQHGLRPSAVQVLLKRSIDRKNYEYVGKILSIQAPNWVANVGTLPTRDAYGNIYDYRLEQVDQPSLLNYSKGISQEQKFRVHDNTIIISHDLNLIDIPVNVIWDSMDEIPKQIKVKLTRFGSTPIPTFTKVVDYDSQSNSFDTQFDDMPVYDISGNYFNYEVTTQNLNGNVEYSVVQKEKYGEFYQITIR